MTPSSSSHPRALALTGAAVVLIGGALVWHTLRPTPLSHGPLSTAQAAYEALQERSQIPPHVQMQHGIARFVQADIETVGNTPKEQAQSYIETFGALYGIKPSSPLQLVVRRVTKVDDEESIVVFAQRYEHLPVFGGELNVSLSRGRVYSTIGSLLKTDEPISLVPILSQADALERARALARTPNAGTYADSQLEIFDPIVSESATASSSTPHLAWRVFLETTPHREVHLDANTGAVLSSFVTETQDYELDLEDANGSEATTLNACYRFTYADDWIGDEDGLLNRYHTDRDAVGTWWNFRNVYTLFSSRFGFDSYDNDGEDIEAYVHAGGSVINSAASYNGNCDIFQFSNGNAALDITAHEFAHAIIGQTSGLVYQNQSGALNESFADIMSVASDNNWLIGEARTGGTDPFRDMANPPRFGDPDTMPPRMIATDNGGVHTNSGIHNKVSFLVSDGGTHNGQTIRGIGRTKMAVLMFNVMRTVPSSAQFNDVRNRAIAVGDFWARTRANGFTVQDACSIRNAYYAAGFRGADDNARLDIDCDGIEDNRDPDRDNDTIPDTRDNCPTLGNIDQSDNDNDRMGDACDPDDDNDSVVDVTDNCPTIMNRDQRDTNRDGVGDACEDQDRDGILNARDNCPAVANIDQRDQDNDRIGDACDNDLDNDTIVNGRDNCRVTPNPTQDDTDRDGIGNSCDNCPALANADQRDQDRDGRGDTCDTDRDGDGIVNTADDCPDSRICTTSRDAMTGTIQLPRSGTSIVRFPLASPFCPTCTITPPVTLPTCHGLSLQGTTRNERFWITNEAGQFVSRFSTQGDRLITSLEPEGDRTYTLNALVTGTRNASSSRIELRVDPTVCDVRPDDVRYQPTTTNKTTIRSSTVLTTSLPADVFTMPADPDRKTTERLKEEVAPFAQTDEKRNALPPEKTEISQKEDAVLPVKDDRQKEEPVTETPERTEPAPSKDALPVKEEPLKTTPEAPRFSTQPPTIRLGNLTPSKTLFYGACRKDQPTLLRASFTTASTNQLTTIAFQYQTLREDDSIAHTWRNAQLIAVGGDTYAVDIDTLTFAATDLENSNGRIQYQIILIDEASLQATRTGSLSLLNCSTIK